MSLSRSLEGFGVAGVVVGILAIWFSFQNQICSSNASGSNTCGPTFFLLIPGVILALIGLGLFFLGYQHQAPPIDTDG